MGYFIVFEVVRFYVVKNVVSQIGIRNIINFGCTIKCYQKWTVLMGVVNHL